MSDLETHRVFVQSSQHVFFTVKNPSRSFELKSLLASDLSHATFWRQVPVQNLEVATALDWLLQGHNDALPFFEPW